MFTPTPLTPLFRLPPFPTHRPRQQSFGVSRRQLDSSTRGEILRVVPLVQRSDTHRFEQLPWRGTATPAQRAGRVRCQQKSARSPHSTPPQRVMRASAHRYRARVAPTAGLGGKSMRSEGNAVDAGSSSIHGMDPSTAWPTQAKVRDARPQGTCLRGCACHASMRGRKNGKAKSANTRVAKRGSSVGKTEIR